MSSFKKNTGQEKYIKNQTHQNYLWTEPMRGTFGRKKQNMNKEWYFQNVYNLQDMLINYIKNDFKKMTLKKMEVHILWVVILSVSQKIRKASLSKHGG